MALSIPSGVLAKYFEVIDSTITTDMFGVVCELVYIEKVEEIVNTFSNIPANNSVNAHRKGQAQYRRQDKVIKEVEKLEDITLKVYWDKRSWTKVGGNIVYPDNGIQTIFFATDLHRIERAKLIIPNKEMKEIKEMRFKKFGEPFPMGIRQNRYYGCFWERA